MLPGFSGSGESLPVSSRFSAEGSVESLGGFAADSSGEMIASAGSGDGDGGGSLEQASASGAAPAVPVIKLAAKDVGKADFDQGDFS